MTSPPWGRSFQQNRAKVEPARAGSFQCHCRILRSDLKTILRFSGVAGLYAVPKNDQQQVSQEYSIIWMQCSLVDLQKQAAMFTQHMGIIRSTKNTDVITRGLRFTRDDFSAAWQKIKPNEDEPTQIAAQFLFKMSPTPVGATVEQLQKLFNGQQWKARPIRALASNVWLCASEERYAEEFLSWNSQAMLLKWLPPRQTQKPIILAGKPPPKVGKKTQGGVDPLSIADPWANAWDNYAKTKSAGNEQQTPYAMPTKTMPPRTVEAPIENRFQQQNDALEQHKEDAREKFAQINEGMTKLQEQLALTNKKFEENQKAVTAEFSNVRQETSEQFQNMSVSFQKSLEASAAKQEKHMSKQFEDLKELILAKSNTPKSKKQKTKKGATGEDEEMSEDL